jgi:hypothetical protein
MLLSDLSHSIRDGGTQLPVSCFSIVKSFRKFSVPTLPFATLAMDPRTQLGLFESRIELLLKLIMAQPGFIYQHVDEPVAVTYQRNTIPDNHNLTFLYKYLASEINRSAK